MLLALDSVMRRKCNQRHERQNPCKQRSGADQGCEVRIFIIVSFFMFTQSLMTTDSKETENNFDVMVT